MASQKLTEYFNCADTSKQERLLVRKLDLFILSFCCVAYFMNQLDLTSVTEAYVSGMKEELNYHGNQLTVVRSLYQLGYTVGIIPMNALISRGKPRIIFPAMVSIWAAVCMCNAVAKTPQQMFAIRTIQGFAESGIFSGTHFILGSWYTETELGKRSGLFTSSGLAGRMASGFLQSGIYTTMNGLHGLSGWRWLFIIDGIITFPVAIYGYFLFPDTPATTTAIYLSEKEKALARSRVQPKPDKTILSMEFVKRVVTSWEFYAFTILWAITTCAEGPALNMSLSLYLKADVKKTYTVQQQDNYPAGVMATGIVSTLLWGTLTDIYGGRWITGYYSAVTGIVAGALALVPSMSEAGSLAAFYWIGTILSCQGTFFAWANATTRHQDPQFRAIIIAAMSSGGNAIQVWWPLIFWAASQSPYFTRGLRSEIIVSGCLAIWVTIMIVVEKRRKKETDTSGSIEFSNTQAQKNETGPTRNDDRVQAVLWDQMQSDSF